MTLLEEFEAVVADSYPADWALAPNSAYLVRISDEGGQVLCGGPYAVAAVNREDKLAVFSMDIPPMHIERSGYAMWLTFQCARFILNWVIEEPSTVLNRRDFDKGGTVYLTATIEEAAKDA